MPQASKILQARQEWRKKAIQRGYQIREFRKSEKRHLARIVELKQQNRELMQASADKKKYPLPPLKQ